MENRSNELRLINMSDIAVEEIKWLWYPFIPYGKVTIVQGDPGEGKTTVMLRIIALLTTGSAFPDSEESRDAVNVIYQTAEDGLADTIKPRLVDAEADCSRVLVIDDADKALTMTDERLELALIRTKAKLVVLDPIQAYLGSEVDMHRANEIRPVMKKIGNLAEKYKCAVVLIGHMNKSSGGKSSYRGLGSIDFQAATRSVLIVGRVKDDPEVRVIVQDKSSLAPEGEPYAFRLSKEKGFSWIGTYEITVDELLGGDCRNHKKKEAEKFLKEILSAGQMPQKEIEAEATGRGIKIKTLRNAKYSLGVDSVKVGNSWYWIM